MARPVKWSRDLHPIRERAANSRTETWSRKDIEALFGIGRVTAQMLMKAIGQIQLVGGAHFVERSSLLSFLDAVIAAPSVEEGLRNRMLDAEPPPKPKPLRVSLPGSLRSVMLPDLPPNVMLAPGRLEIQAPSATAMLESLIILALVMQNDLDGFQAVIEPRSTRPEVEDSELRMLFDRLRKNSL
jgi:hypothetical protein